MANSKLGSAEKPNHTESALSIKRERKSRSLSINRVFIKRYKWLVGDEVVEGVALMHGNTFRGFIPFTEIYRLSDKMVDLLETYESEKKVETEQ